MLPLLYPVTAFIIVGTALASLTIWSRRLLLAKGAAIALSAVLVGTGYAATVELLGRPKPVDIEWSDQDLSKARVIAAEMQEDVAIYVWLGIEGEEAPRSYVLPWSDQAAQQLHGAMQQAEEEGGEVQMNQPFESTPDDEEPMFYATPVEALPPKV